MCDKDFESGEGLKLWVDFISRTTFSNNAHHSTFYVAAFTNATADTCAKV